MRSFRRLAPVTIGALLLAVALPASAQTGNKGTTEPAPTQQVKLKPADNKDTQAAAATSATCEWPVNISNDYAQTKTITSSTARFFGTTDWTDLECGQLTVSVPSGKRAGLVVHTDAEVTCTGATNDDQWCQGRVLVDGLDAFPRALESDGSFAWAQSSTDLGAWEANGFTRSTTLSCASGSEVPCLYNVRVQVRNHGTGLSFRVDDSTVAAQLTYGQ